MTFKHGTDMDVAYREVRDRDRAGAHARCPSDLEQIFIRKDDVSAAFPVSVIGVGGGNPSVARPTSTT